MAKLPSKKSDKSESDNENAQILNVGELHHHGNDLKELRKLAEVNPELAYKVLEAEETKDKRFNTSFRFGLICTVVLLVAAIAAVLFAVVWEGIVSTILLIGLILAIAMLVRVILTGQWSETTWLGRIVSSISKVLGSERDNDED